MRLKAAGDDATVAEFQAKEGDIVSGVVQQGSDKRLVFVNLGSVSTDRTVKLGGKARRIRSLGFREEAGVVLIEEGSPAVEIAGDEVEIDVVGGARWRLRAAKSTRFAQRFVARNRRPRVQIEYDVEVYGAEKKVQLPFVMGVMSDLSGKPADPLAQVNTQQ